MARVEDLYMLAFLSSRNYDDQFDMEEDRDLVAVLNEARSDREVAHATALARQRLAARAARAQRTRPHASSGIRARARRRP